MYDTFNHNPWIMPLFLVISSAIQFALHWREFNEWQKLAALMFEAFTISFFVAKYLPVHSEAGSTANSTALIFALLSLLALAKGTDLRKLRPAQKLSGVVAAVGVVAFSTGIILLVSPALKQASSRMATTGFALLFISMLIFILDVCWHSIMEYKRQH